MSLYVAQQTRHVTDPTRLLAVRTEVSPANVVSLLELLDVLGLDTALGEIRATAGRASALDEYAAARDSSAATDAGKIRAALTSGDLSPADAERRLEAAETRRLVAAGVAEQYRTTALESWSLARRLTQAVGDDLVDLVRPMVDALVGEATHLVDKLPEYVVDDRTALAADPKTGQAWRRLGELATTFESVSDRLDSVRVWGVIPVGGGHGATFAPIDYRFRHPQRINSGRADLFFARVVPTIPAGLALAEVIRAGAEPTVLTHAQALALTEQRVTEEQRRREQQRAAAAAQAEQDRVERGRAELAERQARQQQREYLPTA